MKIQRYDVMADGHHGEGYEADDGEWVRAEDALAAVAAERERCVGIVRSHITKRTREDSWVNQLLEEIVAKIRNGEGD